MTQPVQNQTYRPAYARGVARFGSEGQVQVSFLIDGEVLRLLLTAENARFLRAGLDDQLRLMSAHSERSSGKPAFDVSSPLDGEKG